MWVRLSDTHRWHRYEIEKEDSCCGNATRPLVFIQAEKAGSKLHGQRLTAPPRGEPICAACASGAGFKRRVPKRVHLDQAELEERLEDLIARAVDLLACARAADKDG